MPQFNISKLSGETTLEWARRLFQDTIPRGRLFITPDRTLVSIRLPAPPKYFLHATEMAAVLPLEVDFVRCARGQPDVVHTSNLSSQEASTLFAAAQECDLPVLKVFTREPLLLPLPDGTMTVTAPGYNNIAGHGCFYAPYDGEAPITPLTGTKHLEACFSGVPFEKPHHRRNFLAWLLGAIVLDPLMDTPLLVVTGNQQGVGKSACVQAGGHILSGRLPAPIDYQGGELMKQLGSRFVDGERFMFLDNIVTERNRHYDSPVLSTLLTQGFSKKIRLLGHNRSVSASGILFASSLNNAKLSADLSTRSIVVRLFKETNSPMSPFCRDYAVQHRRELYGELLGVGLLNPSVAAVEASPTFRFRRWLEFVAPRITAAFGPIDINEVETADSTMQELFHWGSDWIDTHGTEGDFSTFTAQDFVTAIRDSRDSYPSLYERVCGNPSERGRSVAAGRFLNGRRGHSMTVGDRDLRLVVTYEAPTEPRRFGFSTMLNTSPAV